MEHKDQDGNVIIIALEDQHHEQMLEPFAESMRTALVGEPRKDSALLGPNPIKVN